MGEGSSLQDRSLGGGKYHTAAGFPCVCPTLVVHLSARKIISHINEFGVAGT